MQKRCRAISSRRMGWRAVSVIAVGFDAPGFLKQGLMIQPDMSLVCSDRREHARW